MTCQNKFPGNGKQARGKKAPSSISSPVIHRRANDGRLVLCDPNTRLPLARIPSMLLGLGMLSISPVFAADVDSVSPANASHTAPLDTTVSATLEDVVSTPPSAGSVVVRSGQTDLSGAIPSISAAGSTITLDPNSTDDPVSRFHPGEQVQATVTSSVTTNSLGAAVPHNWQFRTRVLMGSGVFVQNPIVSLGSGYSKGVALGDLDADGDLDAWVTNYYEEPSRVWENDGNGGFSDTGQTLGVIDSYGKNVALGDLDGDGDLDAVVVGGGAYYEGPNLVWENKGGLVFSEGPQDLGAGYSYVVSLGDVDGDGDLDVVIANYGEYTEIGEYNRVWRNNGGLNFSLIASFDEAKSAGVALGDVDGDGDLDAWVANYQQPNRVWRNLGSGSFQDTGQLLTADSVGVSLSQNVALGDLDGDGDLDAFVANGGEDYGSAPNRVWINKGSASGNFSVTPQTLGDEYTYAIQLGDVDGDGDLDAWVTNASASSQLYLNNGSGTFILANEGALYAVDDPSKSVGVALGDVDGDGDLDAFVTNGGKNFYEANRVWMNTQDMGDAPAPFPTLNSQDGARHSNNATDSIIGTGPRLGIKIDKEFDGQPTDLADGDDDTGSPDEDGVTPGAIQVGNVSASFTVNVQNATGILDAWVDFNRDGSFDAAGEQVFTGRALGIGSTPVSFGVPADAHVGTTFARFRISKDGGLTPRGAASDGEVEDHQLTLTPAQGYGNFAAATSLGLGNETSQGLALGDLDGDNDLDAFVVNASPNRVWRNDGSGTFSMTSSNSLGNGASQDVALGDLDGDGDLDAFVANGSATSNAVWFNNDGSGTFVASGQTLGGASSAGVALGDMDADGHLDAFVANNGSNTLWINDGSGGFAASSQTLGSSDSRGVALGDLNRDGVLDAFVANDGSNSVWLNDGSGTFSNVSIPGGNTSEGVALGDVNGDGHLDAVVANTAGQANRVWLNDGSGSFSISGNSLGSASSLDVALGDIDGDGYLDAVFANTGQGNRVWLNNGSGLFIDSTNSLGTYNSNGIALGDTDGDGDLDVFVANASPNRVWLNQPEADGGDGFLDTVDNCPAVSNNGQEDLDSDGDGNVCDDDVDGDNICIPAGGEVENDCDLDDDNDGVLDSEETGGPVDNPHAFDPDRDDDGIIDGLDRSPDLASNLCTSVGPDAEMNAPVNTELTCADSSSITIKSLTEVQGTGDLELISPDVIFESGFEVQPSGKLSVISKDPMAEIMP